MNEPRTRIPVADTYLCELGRATYNFAYVEWSIVWLTETLQRGFLAKVPKLMAGQIAKMFSEAARGLADNEPDKSDLLALAATFANLVEDRNRLMHGNPHSSEEGEQRLIYDGKHRRKDWTIHLIQQFSDEAALAGIEAGRILHGSRYSHWRNGAG